MIALRIDLLICLLIYLFADWLIGCGLVHSFVRSSDQAKEKRKIDRHLSENIRIHGRKLLQIWISEELREHAIILRQEWVRSRRISKGSNCAFSVACNNFLFIDYDSVQGIRVNDLQRLIWETASNVWSRGACDKLECGNVTTRAILVWIRVLAA